MVLQQRDVPNGVVEERCAKWFCSDVPNGSVAERCAKWRFSGEMCQMAL